MPQDRSGRLLSIFPQHSVGEHCRTSSSFVGGNNPLCAPVPAIINPSSQDISIGQARALLDFMYRGRISVRKEEVKGLLRVAETLQVEGLLKCRDSLNAVSATRGPPPFHSDHTYMAESPNSDRHSRTQFTGLQLKVLQDHFEKNNYCDPGTLEYLAELLDLNQRVIQVWYQNARQKSRRLKQRQSMVESERSQSHYQCPDCLDQFPTYLDLIIHQVQPCQQEEDEEDEDKMIKTAGPDCETRNQEGQHQYQPTRGSTESESDPADQIVLPLHLEELMEQFEQFSEKTREDQETTEVLVETERDENENRKTMEESRSLVIDEGTQGSRETLAQATSRPLLRIVNVKTLQSSEWNTATEETQRGELV